jgi:hypothetical protein
MLPAKVQLFSWPTLNSDLFLQKCSYFYPEPQFGRICAEIDALLQDGLSFWRESKNLPALLHFGILAKRADPAPVPNPEQCAIISL